MPTVPSEKVQPVCPSSKLPLVTRSAACADTTPKPSRVANKIFFISSAQSLLVELQVYLLFYITIQIRQDDSTFVVDKQPAARPLVFARVYRFQHAVAVLVRRFIAADLAQLRRRQAFQPAADFIDGQLVVAVDRQLAVRRAAGAGLLAPVLGFDVLG